MADQVAVATFTTPAVLTDTVDITSPDITDTCMAAVVLFSSETTDDANQAHAITGIGFVADDGVAADTLGCGLTVRSADALTSTQITRTVGFVDQTTAPVILVPVDGATTSDVQIVTEFTAFISGGLRLTASDVDAQTKGSALLFAGVSRAYSGLFTSSTVGVAEPVGGSGNEFEPDLVICVGIDGTYTDGGSFNLWGVNSLCFALNDGGPTMLGSLLGWNNAADPSDADGIVESDIIPSMTQAGAFRTVSLAFTATGFTATASAGSPDFAYLAVKFADPDTRFGAFNFPVAASTGEQSFSCGFLPRAVIGMSQLITTEDAQTDGLGGFGRSMFSASTARAIAASSQDGLTVSVSTPSVAKTYQSDAALVTLGNDASLVQKATLTGFTGSGFTLDFSAASAAGLFTCLAIGVDFPPIALSDTEGISEQAVVFLNRNLALSDVVNITDPTEGDEIFTTDVSSSAGPQGWVYTGQAERGTSLQGGAVAGTFL